MRLFIVLLCLVAMAYSSYAQNDLYVLDPQRNWDRRDGTIEKAAIVMKPQGVYTLVDLYLTFSARYQAFNPDRNLEVVFEFQLPEDAHVIDSWLWIDDVIIKAEMQDRWTASQFYEEIVGRNQDPSILFKNGGGHYALRIFPMAPESSRKVKISYLLPADWEAEKVSTALPLSLLQSSLTPLQSANIRVWLPTEWGAPRLEGTSTSLVQVSDESLGHFWETNLTADQLAAETVIQLATDSPAKEGVFVGTIDHAGTSFYQMVLFPEVVANLPESVNKKLMVAFDYNATNAGLISQAYLLEMVKAQLKQRLSPQDSFNLVFSDLMIEPWSNHWLPGDDETINATFASLAPSPIAAYSNLPSLLSEGLQFIQQQGGGTLLLAASNDDFNQVEEANTLIADLLNLMGEEKTPISILDYQNSNFSVTWINNQYFIGNEYFYVNLSRLTGGYYTKQANCCSMTSFDENIAKTFLAATALKGQMDIYTGLEEGFCYQRYTLGQQNEQINLSQPFRQIGKYTGQFPFHIELAGEYQNNFFGNMISLDETQLIQSGPQLREAWTGQFIKQLEKSGSDNATISTIINRSIEDRVLSLYTALIALEPSQGGEICLECIDEGGEEIVSTEAILGNDSLLILNAFPNPFKEKVTIHLQLNQKVNPADCQFEIFNLMGQKVMEYKLSAFTSQNEFTLDWEGTSSTGAAVSSGVYFFIARTPLGTSQLKLQFL